MSASALRSANDECVVGAGESTAVEPSSLQMMPPPPPAPASSQIATLIQPQQQQYLSRETNAFPADSTTAVAADSVSVPMDDMATEEDE